MSRTVKRDNGALTAVTDEPERRGRKTAHPGEQELLRKIIDGLSPSVFVGLLTVDGRLIYANRAALEVIGAKPEEVLGKPFEATPWWAGSDVSREHLRMAIEAAVRGVASRFDFSVRDSTGRVLCLDFTLHPVTGEDGQVDYLVPSACDVTERKKVEQALRFTQFAVDRAHDCMLQVGSDGRVRYANDAAGRLLGYAWDALLGMPIHQIDLQIAEADWPVRWRELRSEHAVRFETLYRHCSGETIPVEVSASYIQYGDEEYSFVYVADVSKRKAAEDRLQYLAHYDPLTGLPNRDMVRERIKQSIDVARLHGLPLTVLFIGLDRFKLVNAALGHGGGDEVLRAVANRLRDCMRKMDAIGRIGADEFVVALAGDAPRGNQPSQAAQLIMEALKLPIMVDRQEVFVTCSIGAAVYPLHGADTTTLVKNSCAAMYRAKGLGRNTFHLYSGEVEFGNDPERLSLEAALRKVLQRNEFRVHFQPQMDLRSGKIRAAETLLRWQQPDDGLLPPVRFIPIAEETGLILQIGEWVLRAACIQRRAWQEQGLELDRVAVNLSARQFRQHDLTSNVARVLQETGVDPGCLELELTESILMQDVESAIDAMCELKKLGVWISLDDFGTGYSSLSYLKRFPIDTLKIDQSFVREITSDRTSAAIAEAIIALAHRLELTVVAEGVETEAQLAMLRDAGCDQAQGFIVCKPLPAEELTQLLRAAPGGAVMLGR